MVSTLQKTPREAKKDGKPPNCAGKQVTHPTQPTVSVTSFFNLQYQHLQYLNISKFQKSMVAKHKIYDEKWENHEKIMITVF